MNSWKPKFQKSILFPKIQFLIKLNIYLPYDPETLLLGIYPRKKKTHFYNERRTQMFIIGLFITTNNWTQSNVLPQVT